MSYQGNIIVVEDGYKFVFTTVRWSGAETPWIARRALHTVNAHLSSIVGNVDHALWAIGHDSNINSVVQAIGNEDVPTITLDFDRKEVVIEYSDRKVQDRLVASGNSACPFRFSFEEFLNLDFENKNMATFMKEYEQ